MKKILLLLVLCSGVAVGAGFGISAVLNGSNKSYLKYEIAKEESYSTTSKNSEQKTSDNKQQNESVNNQVNEKQSNLAEAESEPEFEITVIEQDHVKVTPSKTKMKVGELITIEVVLDDGYVLDKLTANGIKIKNRQFYARAEDVVIMAFVSEGTNLIEDDFDNNWLGGDDEGGVGDDGAFIADGYEWGEWWYLETAKEIKSDSNNHQENGDEFVIEGYGDNPWE